MASNDILSHPIKLNYVGLKEMHAVSFVPPGPDVMIKDEDLDPEFTVGHEYNEELSHLSVSLCTEIGENPSADADKFPVYIKLAIIGFFTVDESRFDIKNIDHFATKNAYALLMPYARSYIHQISSMCGMRPINLKLIQLPVFKREDMKAKSEDKDDSGKAYQVPTEPEED